MDTTILTALAEPNRLQIVELLRAHPRSVNEIAMLLRLRQPQVSKHLRTLADAGLVAIHPVAQQRIYSLRPEPFAQLEQWIAAIQSDWDNRLDNLENYLNNK